jgi:hypothetical protein
MRCLDGDRGSVPDFSKYARTNSGCQGSRVSSPLTRGTAERKNPRHSNLNRTVMIGKPPCYLCTAISYGMLPRTLWLLALCVKGKKSCEEAGTKTFPAVCAFAPMGCAITHANKLSATHCGIAVKHKRCQTCLFQFNLSSPTSDAVRGGGSSLRNTVSGEGGVIDLLNAPII